MKIRLAADLQPDSIVDGAGIRTVIWTQGCSHHCPGCHNLSTHDFKGGALIDIEEIKIKLNHLKGQNGITLSGGDPMFQAEACLEVAKHAKEIGLNVWCYSGFTYEQLIQNKKQLELLKYIDVLVDGKFHLNEFSLNLPFRGSRNQRIIDVPESLKEERVILIKKYNEEKKEDSIQQREEYIFV